MSATLLAPARTLAHLLEELGSVAPSRVRLVPAPGTATVADAIEIDRLGARPCELVDGVLVEKAMGFVESLLAGFLVAALRAFVIPRNLGVVTAPDGMLRIHADLLRIPDVAFISWARIPGGQIPTEAAPALVPDLVIEVRSSGNASGEVARKVREYFAAGVRLVWLVEPETRTVQVLISPISAVVLTVADTLDGGEVLPGFTLPVASLFAELGRSARD